MVHLTVVLAVSIPALQAHHHAVYLIVMKQAVELQLAVPAMPAVVKHLQVDLLLHQADLLQVVHVLLPVKVQLPLLLATVLVFILNVHKVLPHVSLVILPALYRS